MEIRLYIQAYLTTMQKASKSLTFHQHVDTYCGAGFSLFTRHLAHDLCKQTAYFSAVFIYSQQLKKSIIALQKVYTEQT